MSYKTKQEAFTAMKDALATLQKLNLPLPKPYQDLVDKCAKVVAANTKTDAVAMDLGGDKTTLTITIDGLDFVPKHLKILSVANKNTVHNVSKSALTTETVPIDKLKHGETYKVLLYADEKPAPDAKPKNITPFTFDKKYDKVLVKIKTKSKETPQKDQPQKCSADELNYKYDSAKIALDKAFDVVKTGVTESINAMQNSLALIIPAVYADGAAPSLGASDFFKDFAWASFKTGTGYIPIVGDIIKDGIQFREEDVNNFAKHTDSIANIKFSSNIAEDLKNWGTTAQQAIILDKNAFALLLQKLWKEKQCNLLDKAINGLSAITTLNIPTTISTANDAFIIKVAVSCGVTMRITHGFISLSSSNEYLPDFTFITKVQFFNSKSSLSAFNPLITVNTDKMTVDALKKKYAMFKIDVIADPKSKRNKMPLDNPSINTTQESAD